MKKVIVIGAGISGLSAAIYAAKSGFDVTICEQHSIAGGMCTSWKRKGYLFEGAVHWLTGSSPKTAINQLWKETGALNENTVITYSDPFRTVENEQQEIRLYRNIEKTAEELLTLSPIDKKFIKRLVYDVKAFGVMQMPVTDIKGLKTQNPQTFKAGAVFKMFPALTRLKRLTGASVKEYTGNFKSPAIRRLLGVVPDEYSALSLVATLATFNIGDGGFPEGGSLSLVGRMEKTYTDLGGKLLLNTKVKKVNIKNRVATGVTLENGTNIEADAVIVTAETIAAFGSLFENPPKDEWLAEMRQKTKPAVCTFVGIGIRTDIDKENIPAWKLNEPIIHAGRNETEIGFNLYKGKVYAPEGCVALTTIFIGDTYDFWKKAKDEGRYAEEKKILANQIEKTLIKKFPETEGKIEVIDIATPLTYERYTGAFHGSWMGIMGAGDGMKSYPGYVNDVKGLFFAGHRMTSPGGLPVAVESGRRAAQLLCREFDTVFKNRP